MWPIVAIALSPGVATSPEKPAPTVGRAPSESLQSAAPPGRLMAPGGRLGIVADATSPFVADDVFGSDAGSEGVTPRA